jgi:hypothetical protein
MITPGGGGAGPTPQVSCLTLLLELDYLSSLAEENIDATDKFKLFEIKADFILKNNFKTYLLNEKYLSNDIFIRLSKEYPRYLNNLYMQVGEYYGFNGSDMSRFFIWKSPVSSDVIYIEKRGGRMLSKKRGRQYLEKLEDLYADLLFKNIAGDPYDGGKSAMIRVHLPCNQKPYLSKEESIK